MLSTNRSLAFARIPLLLLACFMWLLGGGVVSGIHMWFMGALSCLLIYFTLLMISIHDVSESHFSPLPYPFSFSFFISFLVLEVICFVIFPLNF